MKKTTKVLFLILMFVLSSCQLPGFGTKSAGCGPSTLKIGDHSYQIKTIKAKKDNSLNIPANKADTAYWVDGTNINQVFALSPVEENFALPPSLKNGDAISVMWENCNSNKYTVSGVQAGVPASSALLDQSTSQVTIFVRAESTGFVIKGDLAEETISTFDTPDASEKQAEISLLEASASQDETSVEIRVSIRNTGSSAFDLTSDDLSLTAQDGTQLTMIARDPALPKEVRAGKTESFSFLFQRPATQTATLKILGVEYDVEGY